VVHLGPGGKGVSHGTASFSGPEGGRKKSQKEAQRPQNDLAVKPKTEGAEAQGPQKGPNRAEKGPKTGKTGPNLGPGRAKNQGGRPKGPKPTPNRALLGPAGAGRPKGAGRRVSGPKGQEPEKGPKTADKPPQNRPPKTPSFGARAQGPGWGPEAPKP